VFGLMSVNFLKTSNSKYLFLAFIILIIYLSPLYILGENAHIRDHDNLDSNIAWYKVLVESGELFGSLDAKIPQVMNGNLSRNSLGSELTGIVWLHALFPSMVAYALSQTVTRVIAFLGMYLLLKHHFIKDKNDYLIVVGVALAFALTPFWPSGMLSTLGHPLALWAFLNIRSGDYHYKNWITLALIPFYASLVLGFIFFLALMGLLWLRDIIIKRKWNFVFLGSIAFMTIIFILVDYRVFSSLIMPHELTQRSEFISSRHSIWRSIHLSIKNYILGHHHVMTVHTFVILPLSFFAIEFLLKNKTVKQRNSYLYLFILNILLSVWYAFWFNNMWDGVKNTYTIATTFNFARFHFVRPLVIYLIFALTCYILWNIGKRWKKVIKGALVVQILLLFIVNEEIVYRVIGTPSFKEYYATEQFSEIRDFINVPQEDYRVVSIGIHPIIAQYNGFYTLDSYNNFYPLTYKYQFRKIIEKELDKNDSLRKYYDEWGSRCYVFVDELGKKYDYKKDSSKQIKNLQFNTKVFKKMGGEYVFSAVPIKNASSNSLELMKIFDHEESAWRIYLYKAL
jgi:hypothetical protein